MAQTQIRRILFVRRRWLVLASMLVVLTAGIAWGWYPAHRGSSSNGTETYAKQTVAMATWAGGLEIEGVPGASPRRLSG